MSENTKQDGAGKRPVEDLRIPATPEALVRAVLRNRLPQRTAPPKDRPPPNRGGGHYRIIPFS